MAPARIPKDNLSQSDLDRRKIVGVHTERVTNTADNEFPGHYTGEEHAWDVEEFKKSFNIHIHQSSPYDMTFSLTSTPAPIANAFRRILIAEVPTLAIERVFIHNNTSIIQDEVLAHRLGLIPITAPQSLLKNMRWAAKSVLPEDQKYLDTDTLVFNLSADCTRNDSAAKSEEDPKELFHNAHIYAKDIKWMPQGRQEKWAGPSKSVGPVNLDILVAKLRPGQTIELEAHAIKGTGDDHAKFSPVATASYRLLPTIDIIKPILGADAKKFARCFPRGVVGLEVVSSEEASKKGSGYEGHAGEDKAVIKDTFKDTVSRECLRHEEFTDKVQLGRVRDHFIFGVESTGQYESDWLFAESVKILKRKAQLLKNDLGNIML